MKRDTFPILYTERLILRYLQSDEVNSALEYEKRNYQRFVPTSPYLPDNFLSLRFWKDRIQTDQDQFYQDQSVKLYLIDKASNQIIGKCSFSNIKRSFLQSCLIGYNVDQDFEGKGYMTEALEEAIGYMFNERKLHKIDAFFMISNQKSRALLQRLGFEEIGLCKQEIMINGIWEDHIYMRLINEGWSV